MDKYEFNIKVEQIKKLISKSDYGTAMKIADTIDWKRVRNTNLLSMVATVYEKNEEYQDAKDILLLAFERAPIGKRLLYKLTELALKEGNTSEAEAYYREFCDLAPDDPRQNLLRYLILKGKGAPVEQLLHSLESYISIELDEKWMYELAELYQKAGLKDECVKMCDKIMLMFGLGQYVDKAMELKVQYAPLTQYQMDLVENRDKYEARLRKVEAEFSGSSYRRRSLEPEEEYEDEQDSDEESRQMMEADLAAKMQEAEVEEKLAAEMSRISIEDYPDDDQMEKTRTFTDLKNLKTNTEHVVNAMPGMAAGMMGAAGSGLAGGAGLAGAGAGFVGVAGAAGAGFAGSAVSAAEAAAHAATDGYAAGYGAGSTARTMAEAESMITAEQDLGGYDQPDYGPMDAGEDEYGSSDQILYGQSDYSQFEADQDGYAQDGYVQEDYSQDGYDQPVYGQDDYAENDYNDNAQEAEYEEVPKGHYVMIEEISPARGLELAVETLKYIHRELGTKHQVAKITGEKLNNRGVYAVSEKIAGKDLIVEQAGALSDIVMEELEDVLDQDKTGINVVLIDSPRRIEIICQHNPTIAEKFERIGAIEEEEPVQEEAPVIERESTPILKVVQPVQETPPAAEPDEEEYEDEYDSEVNYDSDANYDSKENYDSDNSYESGDNYESGENYESEENYDSDDNYDSEDNYDSNDGYEEDSYEAEEEPEDDHYEEPPKRQEKPEPKPKAKHNPDELSAEEFAQHACQYASDIDCSITGKSMLALYERIEIMEEDGIPLTKENAEQLIEEAADKAEKPSFGKLLKGIVSPKYDKDGLLILKEEHFIN